VPQAGGAFFEVRRDGQLDGPEGAALIRGQLADASAMAAALLRAAWDSSVPTDEQVEKWLRYDTPPGPP